MDVKEEEDMMTLRRMMLRRQTDPKTGKHTLREPAQSKCTWTFHKSHLGNLPKNARRPGYHLDQTPGLNTYRKNPSVWPHCLGNKKILGGPFFFVQETWKFLVHVIDKKGIVFTTET